MEQPGAAPLTVAVGPVAPDARPDNDRRTSVVQVADDKARVLIVEGEARWEFRYLRNALTRDPRVAVEAVVFHQPKTGLGADATFVYGTAPPAVESGKADLLGAFDAVVVGDLDPADAPGEFWARIDAYVSERGGTLILLPGPRFAAALAGNAGVRKLLPVLDPAPVPVDPSGSIPNEPALPPGVVLAPTDAALADGSAWPMLSLASEPAENRRRWSALPGLPWVLSGRIKPGATALATAGGDPARPSIATQSYGLGKVLWVGTDGTWRWRLRVGDAIHHRFWGQVARWAAAGKLVAGNGLVRFGPGAPRVAEGESVRLQARIADGVPGVRPDLLIAARVFKAGPDPGEAAAVVPLRPVAGRPRTFEGVAPALPQGAYVARLDAPSMADALGLNPKPPATPPEATLEVAARDTSERVELAASREAVERLASATGGQVVADHDAGRLPGLLRARTRDVVRVEEVPLWDQPGALVLFVTILTVEWVARKRAGLP
jgi:hypothetical protein